MSKKVSSRKVKVLNAFCSFSLLVSLIYALVAGFSYIVIGVMVAAIASIAAPASLASDGVMDALIGIIQSIFEGVALVIEVVGNAISSLFSW